MNFLLNSSFLSVLIILCLMGWAQAADLSKAQGTVSNIKEADPPQVSTETKPSPVGEPQSWYKPTPSTLTINEPPSPTVNRNNPQNDPDVQAGYDAHQR